ncbi:hypothetical protein T4D_5013 [Trichinella pseudospiralis]|uniref:Uncharacterized protein n=1 Tax=Trichinella pseudospiralis TaxID=6337 RepID=A0A0V1G5W6_TRIPS|nr:hypothetical protein T4D_5013 [Trichinella pseudospiralis]
MNDASWKLTVDIRANLFLLTSGFQTWASTCGPCIWYTQAPTSKSAGFYIAV